MEEKVKSRIADVFDTYLNEYGTLLKKFEPCPSKDKGDIRYSLHEVNQVVNFLSAYRTKHNNSITWLEFPIRYKDGDKEQIIHIDGLIVDHDNRNVFFIEAKRLSKLQALKNLQADLNDKVQRRWTDHKLNGYFNNDVELNKYGYYCILLADFRKNTSLIKANTFGSSHLNDDGTLKWKEKMDKCLLKPIEEAIDLKSVKGDYYLAYALFCLKNPAQE